MEMFYTEFVHVCSIYTEYFTFTTVQYPTRI